MKTYSNPFANDGKSKGQFFFVSDYSMRARRAGDVMRLATHFAPESHLTEPAQGERGTPVRSGAFVHAPGMAHLAIQHFDRQKAGFHAVL